MANKQKYVIYTFADLISTDWRPDLLIDYCVPFMGHANTSWSCTMRAEIKIKSTDIARILSVRKNTNRLCAKWYGCFYAIWKWACIVWYSNSEDVNVGCPTLVPFTMSPVRNRIFEVTKWIFFNRTMSWTQQLLWHVNETVVGNYLRSK